MALSASLASLELNFKRIYKCLIRVIALQTGRMTIYTLLRHKVFIKINNWVVLGLAKISLCSHLPTASSEQRGPAVHRGVFIGGHLSAAGHSKICARGSAWPCHGAAGGTEDQCISVRLCFATCSGCVALWGRFQCTEYRQGKAEVETWGQHRGTHMAQTEVGSIREQSEGRAESLRGSKDEKSLTCCCE